MLVKISTSNALPGWMGSLPYRIPSLALGTYHQRVARSTGEPHPGLNNRFDDLAIHYLHWVEIISFESVLRYWRAKAKTFMCINHTLKTPTWPMDRPNSLVSITAYRFCLGVALWPYGLFIWTPVSFALENTVTLYKENPVRYVWRINLCMVKIVIFAVRFTHQKERTDKSLASPKLDHVC